MEDVVYVAGMIGYGWICFMVGFAICALIRRMDREDRHDD